MYSRFVVILATDLPSGRQVTQIHTDYYAFGKKRLATKAHKKARMNTMLYLFRDYSCAFVATLSV